MAAAPANAGMAAAQAEFMNSMSRACQSGPKLLSTARSVGHKAPRTQQKKVPWRSCRSGTIAAIKATTSAATAVSKIQPYQYMGGLSAGGERYTQNSTRLTLGR